jgi:uracil-DNA glycosylase
MTHKKLSQSDLPHHTCDIIDSKWVDFFLQEWKGLFRRILVLGESPALNWRVLSWRAFYTLDGKLVASWKRFNELFSRFWFGIEDVSFSEICKCILGKQRWLLKKCSPKCAWHLLKQIDHCKPKLIIILGKHTLEVFNEMYGLAIPFGSIESIVLWEKERTLFSLYHPSPIHPRSMEWNKELIHSHAKEIEKILWD